MQTATDPFPGSVTSRPNSLAGEIERLRFVIVGITGQNYWYNPPQQSPTDTRLTGLNSRITAVENGIHFPGTTLPFYQSAAPIGWTLLTGNNDKALRVVNTSGGTTGGTNPMSTGLSHSHTVNSHTHDLANHTHQMASHTHSTPNHQHLFDYNGPVNYTTLANSVLRTPDSDGNSNWAVGGTTGGSNGSREIKNQTQNSGASTTGVPSTNTSNGPSTNTSGATSPSTDTQAPTFQYMDVILCVKN